MNADDDHIAITRAADRMSRLTVREAHKNFDDLVQEERAAIAAERKHAERCARARDALAEEEQRQIRTPAPQTALQNTTERVEKRRTRADNLKRAIFDAWDNGCPLFPASAMFDYLAAKDQTGFIRGRDGDELSWENSSGKLSFTRQHSLENRLPKYRKEYEKGT